MHHKQIVIEDRSIGRFGFWKDFSKVCEGLLHLIEKSVEELFVFILKEQFRLKRLDVKEAYSFLVFKNNVFEG